MSSGFLAFARHVGVLQAIEARRIDIDAVVGTSSGALIGALWASGRSGAELESLLGARRPYQLFRPHVRPWQGAFSLDPLIAWLRELLPPTFADLPRPLAVGVSGSDGSAHLLRSGPLPEAVAASCAIPVVFAPVSHGGVWWQDGGATDRLMLAPWRAWRGEGPAIVHLVDRMAGRDTEEPLDAYTVVRTPRSGASFFSLGDVQASVSVARERTAEALAKPTAKPGFAATTPVRGRKPR